MHQFNLIRAALAAAPPSAQPVGGAVDAASVAQAVEITSVLDFLIKGGPVMIPIALCSLVAMAVVIERLVTLRRRRVIPPAFLSGLKPVLSDADDGAAKAIEYCRKRPSAVSRVVAAGIRRMNGPIEVMERHIQEAGEREAMKLRKNLRVLAVIAAIAPLLGLLGTIFGMITAFQTVAASAEALGKTELLAAGIYQAMITTAAGLVVAIPVLICYHWISARIDRLVMDIDSVTMEFVEEHAVPIRPGAPLHDNGQDALRSQSRLRGDQESIHHGDHGAHGEDRT